MSGAGANAGANGSRRAIRSHILMGAALSLLLVGGIGGWAATSKLAGAVIAGGSVVVEANLKKVQHPTGGVVGEIRVRDGSVVKAGDILLRLDETVTRANLSVVAKSLDELDGCRSRLEAERDGAEALRFSAGLLEREWGVTGRVGIVSGEKTLFDARQTARLGQKAQLKERSDQLRQEIAGLEAQKEAKATEIDLIRDELKGVEELYSKNLAPLTRVNALRREAARLTGERGQVLGSIAQARGRIAEIALQAIQIDQDLRTEVARELRELEGKWGELVERKVAAED